MRSMSWTRRLENGLRGEDVEILPQHLRPVHPGNRGNGWNTTKQCRNCGFTTTEDYEFCPKCGLRF